MMKAVAANGPSVTPAPATAKAGNLRNAVKRCVGRCVIQAAEIFPGSRPLLGSIGIRTSQDLFGQRIVSIPLEKGKSFRLTHIDDSYLGFQLFWHGADFYEPITRALLHRLLRPGDAFVDIGAHLGFFSLAIGRLNPGVKIFAFEPNPQNFRNLAANMDANGHQEVVCEPVAISDRDGEATLYLTDSDMSASLMKGFQAEDTIQTGSVQVRTTSLDDYVEHHQIQSPMVLKIDIEGHEPAFFRGASQTIAMRKPDIILEVLYDQDRGLVSHLKSLGYHFYPITDEGLVEMEAPRLIKRYPFLFLNHLLSARPKQEIATIFEEVTKRVRNINLLRTSKHFPKDQWPGLWAEATAPAINNL